MWTALLSGDMLEIFGSRKSRNHQKGQKVIRRGPLALAATILLLSGFVLQYLLAGELYAMTLNPCPASPNCVSSLAEDPAKRIDPFPTVGSPAETWTRLERAVRSFPRTLIVVREERYLKAEFRTRLGFVDDVEFQLNPDLGLVQVRSASRTGYWDLGVNRRRVEAIRKAYQGLRE